MTDNEFLSNLICCTILNSCEQCSLKNKNECTKELMKKTIKNISFLNTKIAMLEQRINELEQISISKDCKIFVQGTELNFGGGNND